MSVLTLHNVSKSFGSLPVINNLSFSVDEHTVFGFIGKNGAGKTTTMKMVLGLLKPDSGEITVCGQQVKFGSTETNKYVGYLPDVPVFYGYMTPREYLRLCGEITGMKNDAIKLKSDELLQLVGLADANRKINGFSRGMKQRLGIAQALLNEPRLLICDEPTSALDPVGRIEILDILSVARQKTTVIFSTHILSDVERICDHIGVLDGGNLKLCGDLQTVQSGYQRDFVLLKLDTVSERLASISEDIKKLPSVTETRLDGGELVVKFSDLKAGSHALLGFLAASDLNVIKYEMPEPSLENLFLEAIK